MGIFQQNNWKCTAPRSRKKAQPPMAQKNNNLRFSTLSHVSDFHVTRFNCSEPENPALHVLRSWGLNVQCKMHQFLCCVYDCARLQPDMNEMQPAPDLLTLNAKSRLMRSHKLIIQAGGYRPKYVVSCLTHVHCPISFIHPRSGVKVAYVVNCITFVCRRLQ